MSLRQRILRALGYTPKPRLSFEVDQALIQSLQEIAAQEQRHRDEVAADLLSYALARYHLDDENKNRWRSLSPREQQIAALVCLNYSNPQIATHLMISPQTTKTHVRNILHKFGLRSKDQLRRALAGWDFNAWLPGAPTPLPPSP